MSKLRKSQIKDLSLNSLEISGMQPRRLFEETALIELSISLKDRGSLQPILVRPVSGGDKYDVIMGARRVKAAQIASFKKIPAIVVKEINDSEALEIALTENMQREDLTPFEEAWGILKLIKDYGYTMKDVQSKLGKSDGFVRRRLMLLKLPEQVQKHVSNGRLGMDSAISLGKFDSSKEQIEAAEKIIDNTLSTTKAKEMINKAFQKISEKGKAKPKEVTGKKILRQITQIIESLQEIELEKLSFPTREEIKEDLLELEKQIKEIVGMMDTMT